MPSVFNVGSQQVRSAQILSADAHVSVAFTLGAAPCFFAPPLALMRDVGVTPTGYLRSRMNGPNHLRFDVRS